MTSLWLRTMTKRYLTQPKCGTVITGERQYFQNLTSLRLENIIIGQLVNWYFLHHLSITDCIILASVSQQKLARSWVKCTKESITQQKLGRKWASQRKERIIHSLASITQKRLERKLVKQRMANISQQRLERRWVRRAKASLFQRKHARRWVKRGRAAIFSTME